LIDSWHEWLAKDGWLKPQELQQAEDLHAHAKDQKDYADQLVKNGLISSFQANHLLAGTVANLDCGRYRLRKFLGRGGMGEVYAAVPRNRRDIPVAIKLLPISLDQPDEQRKRMEIRFLREMQAGRSVRHSSVTPTIDFGRDHIRFFLVMPRLKGPSFEKLIELKGNRPEPKTVIRMASQINEGLHAIHTAGLVHRDLKPSNILYDGYKRWMILDLGLAKALGERQSLTKPGVILGTLDYAAPEQLKDASKVDWRADYYALGCILFHAFAGRVPFEGGDAVSKIYRHRITPAEPLGQLRPDLDQRLTQLVDSLLQKEPEKRPGYEHTKMSLESLLTNQQASSDSFQIPAIKEEPEEVAAAGLAEEKSPDDIPTEQIDADLAGQWLNAVDVAEETDDWAASEPRGRLIQTQAFRQNKRPNPKAGLKTTVSLTILTIFLLSIGVFMRSLVLFVQVAAG
jgi:serine/threonine protein kinase